VNIEEKLKDGKTIAMAAVRYGQIETLKFLSQINVDINEKRSDGWTLAMSAARYGQIETLQWLAEMGVDINEKRNDGGTIAMVAARYGQLETIKYLVAVVGVSVRDTTRQGLSAVHLADSNGHETVRDYILSIKYESR